jgi:hypothetical protein
LYARLGDKDKAYDYFVKSYKPNSRPLLAFFSESIIVTIRILLQGWSNATTVIYGFGGVEQTDNGLKLMDYCPQVEVSENSGG